MAASWRETRDKSDLESDVPGSSSSLLLYTLLPSLVQRRIPKLRSLKQALLDYETRTRHDRLLSQASVESITPPPSYQSNINDSEQADETAAFRTGRSSSASSRTSSSGSTTPAYLEEVGSGVNWRYAEPGLALLSLASQEASVLRRSPHLVRRQYIDGAACVLRGLPSDLSAEEELCLQEALPQFMTTPDPEGNEVISRPRSSRGDIQRHPASATQRSTLHRCVAAATVYMFLVIAFLTPYIQLLLRQAYQFDRRHRISERALAQSVIAADTMGRQTIMIAQRVCSLNDGKVGEAMKGVGVYCVQGFSGGVYDGVGEGMHALGLRDGTTASKRTHLDSDERMRRVR